MTRAFSKSLQLVKESFRILRKDKELMWFPIISGILNGLLIVLVVGVIWYFIAIDPLKTKGNINPYIPFMLILIFFQTVLGVFIANFFKAGLMMCVWKRLNGGDPIFRDGFENARKHIKKIFVWTLISVIIGIILENISKRTIILDKIIGIAGHLIWYFLTFFVIPVIIFEDLGIKNSIKKSGHLFKKTWGENVVGQFSMVAVFALLFLVIMPLIPIMGMSIEHNGVVTYETPFTARVILFVIIIFYLIALGIIFSSLQGIFVTALYYYAITGKIPPDYSPEVIKYAFTPKNTWDFT